MRSRSRVDVPGESWKEDPLSDKITRRPTVSREERSEAHPDDPEVGRWYWVKDRDEDEWLGCVTHVGSNYVKLEGPDDGYINSTYGTRVHFDIFWEVCRYEPDAAGKIRGKVEKHRNRFNGLMEDVKRISGKLGIAAKELTDGDHTQALATRKGEPIPDYRGALVKAKEEELPEIFKQMRHEADMMAVWMKAETIPMVGQRKKLEGTLDKVNRRILAVDLYAGLSEEAVEIRKGKPAEIAEPVRLFQRRHYMDEESLANYKAGGMDYKSIEDFDEWMAQSENRDRILPFPRSIVAFQVRRHTKERRANTLSGFIRIVHEMQEDKRTFLYVRNGEQLWRLSTAIDFGEKLFPDLDEMVLYGREKLWMHTGGLGLKNIITDRQYRALIEKDKEKLREWKKKMAQKKADKAAGKDVEPPGPWDWKPRAEADQYEEFTDKSVYYDDAAKKISDALEEHNRVATVIQGIFDRSPVFAPHPPWKIWTNDGFHEALRLVYDKDRALVGGEKPDFEAYRRRLNSQLKKGCVTVGQERAWLMHEALKREGRRRYGYDEDDLRMAVLYTPYGNDGPGFLARVTQYRPRVKKCVYRWERDRQGYQYDWDGRRKKGKLPCSFQVPVDSLLNVSAYTPGDYKIFFSDPRTREEYLKWAPFLLVAEDYHAGKVQVDNEATGEDG